MPAIQPAGTCHSYSTRHTYAYTYTDGDCYTNIDRNINAYDHSDSGVSCAPRVDPVH